MSAWHTFKAVLKSNPEETHVELDGKRLHGVKRFAVESNAEHDAIRFVTLEFVSIDVEVEVDTEPETTNRNRVTELPKFTPTPTKNEGQF